MKHQNEITYTERDGIFYPELSLPEQPDCPIGKYGQMRLDFLKKHRRGTYTTLLMTFKLNAYLAEIDREARAQVVFLTEAFAKKRGIDENLKATDQLRWVQEMNNWKAQAEEIILKEVIYK